ncbi:MAG: ABC transporter permease [Chloroflexota bacterium]
MSISPQVSQTTVGDAPGAIGLGAPTGSSLAEASSRNVEIDRLGAVLRYLRRNPSLIVGTAMLLGLGLFSGIGALLVDTANARPLSVMAIQPPSWELPFGSDRQGRDLLAVMIAGTPLTIRIGVIAGLIGVGVGTVLAFVSAFYGGILDTVVRGLVDIGLTVPGLLVLIILAVTIREGITVNQMALVVACLAWLYPTRVIRSQVLSMRERSWVQVARLSGMTGPEIIVKEMLPNLFPYLAAALVNSISNAVLASVGLEALGLGPIESPTLGMTVYWVQFNAALINGWWWWWTAPIVILFILFVGLFLVSLGLDEIANPRLRRAV